MGLEIENGREILTRSKKRDDCWFKYVVLIVKVSVKLWRRKCRCQVGNLCWKTVQCSVWIMKVMYDCFLLRIDWVTSISQFPAAIWIFFWGKKNIQKLLHSPQFQHMVHNSCALPFSSTSPISHHSHFHFWYKAEEETNRTRLNVSTLFSAHHIS